jgi:hypothetical protein
MPSFRPRSALDEPGFLPVLGEQRAGHEDGVYLAYDSAHHILYSANFDAGLWRIRTD